MINKYLAVAGVYVEDPYAFWTANKDSFGGLSKIAQQILSAPGTSSACERYFSMTGLFTEARKSNISPENLNAKLILAANKDIIQKFSPL